MSEPITPATQDTEKALPNVPVLPNVDSIQKVEVEKEKPEEVGRPSDLTDELTLEIRKLVLQGLKYTEIQETLEINPSTWDRWVWLDYKDFRTHLNDWIHERIVKKAQKNLEEFIDLPIETIEYKRNWSKDEDDDEQPDTIEIVKTDPALVRIKQDSTKFALERLDKDNFASRSEMTGKGGKALIPVDETLKAKTDQAIEEYLNDTGDTKQQ